MRRSTKASQLISQSGHDEIYRFRCMEYMSFVLDQIMNDDSKFKLYGSHIEVFFCQIKHLIRNNLNDLTIQDIEKVKRMLEEGEKQKFDIQETGEFINYDLLEKQKYTLQRTHFYLEEGPEEALLHLEGFNSDAIHEVQLLKNKHRFERLQEKNYSLLDMMFKLPDVEANHEEEFEKEYDMKMGDNDAENQEFNFEKFENKKKVSNGQENRIPAEPNVIQEKIIQVSQNQNTQEVVSKTEKKFEEKKVRLTPQKSKQLISGQSQKVGSAEAKKKSKKKKVQISSLQKPENHVFEPLAQEKEQKPEGQVEIKQNCEAIVKNQRKEQDQNIKNDQQQKISSSPANQSQPQKRKYIRKKPLEPKKEKPPKQPKQLKKSQSKSEQNKSELLQQIQSNIELALFCQAAELNSLLESEANDILNLAGEDKSKEKSSQLALKDLIRKDSKTKKTKKSEGQQKQKDKSDSKKSKKHFNSKEIQIVLPFPDCEEQVNRLKIEIENLTKKIQDERLEFEGNRQQALNMLTLVQEQQSVQQEQKEKVQRKNEEQNVPAPIQNTINSQNEVKPQQSIEIVLPEYQIGQTYQQRLRKIQQLQMLQALKQKLIKKPKSTTKIAGFKKQNASSQEYKPLEDELEELQQSEGIDESKQEDVYQPGKEKKIKKKKKLKKESTKQGKEKSKQVEKEKIQRVSEENAVKPSESIISVETEPKEKKKKLTPEQRAKIKLERERVKEMKLKMKQKLKEEKEQLKELQLKQFQRLKLKKSGNSEKSSKSQKLNLGGVNSASVEQKKQTISFVQIKAASNPHKILQQIPLQKAQQKDSKNQLNISNGNSSTRQDISLSFVSIAGIQKSFSYSNQHERQILAAIVETQKESIMSQKKSNSQKESKKQKEPEFVSIIAGRSITELLEENIATWEECGKANDGVSDLFPKREKPLEVVEQEQKEQIGDNPKKKIKLACKQSFVFEDPQYGIDDPKEEKQFYTIQIMEHHSEVQEVEQKSIKIQKNQRQLKESQQDAKNNGPPEVQQNLSGDQQHSSSLSADDD